MEMQLQFMYLFCFLTCNWVPVIQNNNLLLAISTSYKPINNRISEISLIVELMIYVPYPPPPPTPDFIGKWIYISTGRLSLNDVIALSLQNVTFCVDLILSLISLHGNSLVPQLIAKKA